MRGVPKAPEMHLQVFPRIVEAVVRGGKPQVVLTFGTSTQASSVRVKFYRWKTMIRRRAETSVEAEELIHMADLIECCLDSKSVTFRNRNMSPLALEISGQLEAQGIAETTTSYQPTEGPSTEDLIRDFAALEENPNE